MKKKVTLEEVARCAEILAAVAAVWAPVTTAAIRGDGRPKAVAEARKAAYLLMRCEGLSWHTIGRLMGRGHQPCLVGARRLERQAQINTGLREKILAAAKTAGVNVGL